MTIETLSKEIRELRDTLEPIIRREENREPTWREVMPGRWELRDNIGRTHALYFEAHCEHRGW